MADRGGPPPRAVVFGVAGPSLTADERCLFAVADPLGFILFARNIADPDQVRALVASLRDVVGRDDAPVLIDQEGGRVARLRPPHWSPAPPAGRIAALARTDPDQGRRAAWLQARLIADDLAALGIDVACAPVLDLPQPDADLVIGDRAVGHDVASTIELGRAWCRGLADGGVAAVIKHIPGHGRARVDSHRALPVVETPLTTLDAVDFAPFRALAAAAPWAMTAHVIYTAVDPSLPATLSPQLINEVIRGRIGFDGVLVSDDLTMGALSGPVAERAVKSLAAGCDVALHCSGDYAEMMAIAAVCPRLTEAAAARLARAAAAGPRGLSAGPFDAVAARAERDGLVAGVAAAGATGAA